MSNRQFTLSDVAIKVLDQIPVRSRSMFVVEAILELWKKKSIRDKYITSMVRRKIAHDEKDEVLKQIKNPISNIDDENDVEVDKDY